jgi:hypothetical protein
VTRAVGYAEREDLDHLTVLPEIRMPGLLLQSFVLTFVLGGLVMLRPWKPRPAGSLRAVGVGAFNLVRRSCYARAGGHEPIRFRPDDDIQLARLLNRAGARADLLLGRGELGVTWYRSVGELIDGLMKNAFSIVDYRPLRMLGLVLLALMLALAAPLAAALGDGVLRGAGLAALGLLVLVHLRGARVLGVPAAAALLFPLDYLLMAWIELRALLLNLAQGGIVWRGTFYRLAELRRHRR